jgi:hypothetical protein
MIKKTCLDCLFCKVAAKSTENNRLCYCSETKSKQRHKEKYWLAKKPCDFFEDMTENKASILLFPTYSFQKTPCIFRKQGGAGYE